MQAVRPAPRAKLYRAAVSTLAATALLAGGCGGSTRESARAVAAELPAVERLAADTQNALQTAIGKPNGELASEFAALADRAARERGRLATSAVRAAQAGSLAAVRTGLASLERGLTALQAAARAADPGAATAAAERLGGEAAATGSAAADLRGALRTSP